MLDFLGLNCVAVSSSLRLLLLAAMCRKKKKQTDGLLRHGTLPRNEDGAIEFWRLKMEFKSDFPNSVYSSNRMWIDHLQPGGGQKKRFQFCTSSNGTHILYLRAIQRHSGENPVDPSLQDNVLVPDNFVEFIYHVGSYFNMHSIIASGLIAVRSVRAAKILVEIDKRYSSQP